MDFNIFSRMCMARLENEKYSGLGFNTGKCDCRWFSSVSLGEKYMAMDRRSRNRSAVFSD